jgi:hypothetical protein
VANETLDFADESEYIDEEEEAQDDRTAIAEMIADWFGRSSMDSDYELADAIIERLTPDQS